MSRVMSGGSSITFFRGPSFASASFSPAASSASLISSVGLPRA